MVFRDKYEYLTNDAKLKEEISRHKAKESIQQTKVSESEIILHFNRAENELKQAKILFEVSLREKLKLEIDILPDDTFYSGAIAHAYYAIFFATKALLLTNGIKTKSPNIHKATLDAFAYYFIATP
ncbi:MAG: HEPN domain-containing protein [Nanoarchaeota archaeon]|nr:HEPN domain-containing protein [Nanoarchaeota archaeon]